MKKTLVVALLLALTFTACEKNEAEQETKVTTETIILDTSVEPSGSLNKDFDSSVKEMAGIEDDNPNPDESENDTQESNVGDVSIFKSSYDGWAGLRCDQIQIDGVTYKYGMSLGDFLDTLHGAEEIDKYDYSINTSALIGNSVEKDALYTTTINKNDEEFFTVTFGYPKGTDDVISIEKTALIDIKPSIYAEPYVIRGNNLDYNTIMSLNYDNFESFLWRNIVPHEVDWVELPKVVTEDGEIYEAIGEGFHKHTYNKPIVPESSNDVETEGEATEGEDIVVETEDVTEEEPCTILTDSGCCEFCKYQVPDFDYKVEEDSANNIVVTYTHTGDDILTDASLWSGFEVYVPSAYDIEFVFSSETREMLSYTFTAVNHF